MKKTLSLILAVIMIVSILPVSLAFAATLGDVTGDGKINSRDIAALQKYTSGGSELTPEQFTAGDVNCDGKVNSRDIAAVQKHVTGILLIAPSTQAPTVEPTAEPTQEPTVEPTQEPTVAPTTEAPTDAPATEAPVVSGPTPPPALSTNLTSNSSTFTVKEIVEAASTIVSHYETYKDMETEYSIAKALPVGNYVISEQDWAYMAGYAINGLSGAYAGSGLSGYTMETKITYKNMGKPEVNAVDQYGGDELTIAEVAEAAWKALSNYGNNNGRVAASCGSIVSVGKQLSYYSIIMATARALQHFNANGSMPATVMFDCLSYTIEDSDSYVKAPEATQAPEAPSPAGNLTISEIVDAFAAEYAKFEETDTLPTTITIGSVSGMNKATYFGVAARAVMAINKGNTTSTIPVKNYKNAEYGFKFDKFDSDTVSKTAFIYMAEKQVTYSDNNGTAANYITFPGSSGTSYSGPANADRCTVIMMRVLSEYKETGALPEETSSWGSDFVSAKNNCEVDDPAIIALANEITKDKETTNDKAKAIFEWVKANITYNFYENTQRSAVKVLNDRVANCCDHAHLVTALARAAKIPARYVHGVCLFPGEYGHVWAELFVDGTWVTCDASMKVNSYGNHEDWTLQTHHANYIELPF
ncbi:MAG: hypothetical protein IJF80_02345 [Clostridia bacterium]|nr:hypothetical protein [Clostridia bacterium]